MATLELDAIHKAYGGRRVLDELRIRVEDGEFFAILGPSGCGKTTVLRIAAGFVSPDGGQVRFDSVDVTSVPPEARDAAMVFQNYALFPHLDVADNVGFGLKARKLKSSAVRQRVARALYLVGLDGLEKADVGNLSGGEQQRVALARALVVEPSFLLLDEPMSNLDQKLRESTRADLRALQRRLAITTLYVTHDQHEALEMADRVAVMEGGRLVQVGSPRELYDRPTSEFVARFLGRANVVDARVTAKDGAGTALSLAGHTIVLRAIEAEVGTVLRVAVRPESIRVGTAPAGWLSLGRGRVVAVHFQGALVTADVDLDSETRIRVSTLNRSDLLAAKEGADVDLWVERDRLVILSG